MELDFSFIDGKELQKTDALDLDSAKKLVLRVEDRLLKMQIEAKDIEIKCDADANQCVEMMAQIKALLKELDDLRKAIIKDADQFVRGVNSFVRPFRLMLENLVEKILKPKFNQYMQKKELERRKEELRLKKEHERKQAELDKEAKKSGVDPVTIDQPVLSQKKDPVRSETGTASTISVWKFEILDADKVPRKYCSPDSKIIGEAVKGGIRKIAGIRIYEDQQTRVRIG